MVKFAGRLRVGEGPKVGQRLVLEPFQLDFLRRVFGPKRLPRRAILSVARRNGKTALCAVIVLAALFGPLVRRNSRVVSASRSREQSALVFDYCVKMIRATGLEHLVVVRDSKKQIYCPQFGTIYDAMAADAKTGLGRGIYIAVVDELGAAGQRDPFYEAVTSSLGTYADSMEFNVSTQGPDDSQLFNRLIDAGLEADDGRTAVVVYEAKDTDDPHKLETWMKANPGLGTLRSLEEIEDASSRARLVPSLSSMFLNLYLNMRVSTDDPWLSRTAWARGAMAPDLSKFERCNVYGGLDLSLRHDLTAGVFLADDLEAAELHTQVRAYTPKGSLSQHEQEWQVPLAKWVDDGHLVAVPGDSVDYQWVAQDLAELSSSWRNLRAVNYDRYNIGAFQDACRAVGATRLLRKLEQCGQGYVSMAVALNVTEHAILARQVRHGNQPVLNWCIANSVVDMDPAGNRKLNKKRSVSKIDLAVAFAMAGKAARGEGRQRTPTKPLLWV